MQLDLNTDEELITALAAFECCGDALRAVLDRDDLMRGPARLPKELRALYERRIDICRQVQSRIEEHRVDLRLDKAFSAPAAIAEKPKRRSRSERKRVAIQNGQEWDGT